MQKQRAPSGDNGLLSTEGNLVRGMVIGFIAQAPLVAFLIYGAIKIF